MPLRSAFSVPPVSPAEMEQMVARAGLKLNPGQLADLVLAWRQIAELAAMIPRDRPLAGNDQILLFRLSPAPAQPAATRRLVAALKTTARKPLLAKRQARRR